MSHSLNLFDELVNLMESLRDPEAGCPWDRVQTFKTIAPYTIEEAYEVEDAIDRGNMEDLKEELGDLLFQVIFHAQMAREQGAFDLQDVATSLIDKMHRRHPHIFGDAQVDTTGQVNDNWEAIKAEERQSKNYTSLMDDVPLNLTALTRALKLQKRAARVGFDWPDAAPIIEKLHEELAEFEAELEPASPNPDRLEDELGDLLFVVVNLARVHGVDPETALRRTNRKFVSRFHYMEKQGSNLTDLSLTELETLWQKAKREENSDGSN